jgi:hypothetical protein
VIGGSVPLAQLGHGDTSYDVGDGSHRTYKSTGLATAWGGFTQGWAVSNCAQRLVQPHAAADAVHRAAHAWAFGVKGAEEKNQQSI